MRVPLTSFRVPLASEVCQCCVPRAAIFPADPQSRKNRRPAPLSPRFASQRNLPLSTVPMRPAQNRRFARLSEYRQRSSRRGGRAVPTMFGNTIQNSFGDRERIASRGSVHDRAAALANAGDEIPLFIEQGVNGRGFQLARRQQLAEEALLQSPLVVRRSAHSSKAPSARTSAGSRIVARRVEKSIVACACGDQTCISRRATRLTRDCARTPQPRR